MNPMLKIAYEAGCTAALVDLGLSKTAEPKWLNMLRADPGLVDEAVLSAGRRALMRTRGSYPLGAASADVAEDVHELLSLEGRRPRDIQSLLSRRMYDTRPNDFVGEEPWSARKDLSGILRYGAEPSNGTATLARRLELIQDARDSRPLWTGHVPGAETWGDPQSLVRRMAAEKINFPPDLYI